VGKFSNLSSFDEKTVKIYIKNFLKNENDFIMLTFSRELPKK